MVCFGLVGILNTIAGFLAILFFMKIAKFSTVLSNVAGYGVGIILSYMLNRRFTFKSRRATRYSMLWFIGAAMVAFGSNLAVLFLTLDLFGFDPVVAQASAVVAYACVFYLLSRGLVFSRAG